MMLPTPCDVCGQVGTIVSLVLRFVPLNKCGPLTSVNRHWQRGALMFEQYVHMRDFKPSSLYQVHTGVCTSVMYHHDKVPTTAPTSHLHRYA